METIDVPRDRILFLGNDLKIESAREFKKKLETFGPGESIFISFDGNGGKLSALREIVAAIEEKKRTNPIVGLVEVEAASSALLALQNCDLRLAKAGSQFLVHRVSETLKIRFRGLEKDILEINNDLQRISKKLEEENQFALNLLMRNAKIPRKSMDELMKAEKHLSAKEALKIGLISQII